MRRSTPTVRHGTLVAPETKPETPIPLGTSAWYAWLETATLFSFVSEGGTFTARKERRQRGGWYWKAYRTQQGKLARAYLGKTEHLTLEHLEQVAQVLSERGKLTETASAGRHDRPPSHPAFAAHLAPTDARLLDTSSVLRPAGRHSPPLAQPEPLLLTKLAVPPLRPGLVVRPRLLDLLNQHMGGQVLLLSAPAGCGKTILLTQWSTQSRARVAWVSLDAGDNDPIRFWRYLLTALERAAPGVGHEALELVQGRQPAPIEAVLVSVLNRLAFLSKELVLILDDYHLITAQPIHEALTFLLDHQPSRLHLMIASRADPPLAVARLRVRQQAALVRARDLYFTPEEVTTFLTASMGLHLSPDQIAALVASTEGWIAALQLAALSLQGQEDIPRFLHTFPAGAQHSLAEYLAEEVLRQQPDAVQAFLSHTAILDRLCGPLCAAVMGAGEDGWQGSDASAQAMLERLEQANLFLLPLDAERRWYRYHHLFAEFLRARLQQGDLQSSARLHERAARWYEHQGFSAEAIHHALAAPNYPLGARLIEAAADQTSQRGELSTLSAWLEALPEETLRRQPRLCLVQARALVTSGQMERAETRLHQAEQAIPEGTEPHPPSQEVLGEIAAIRAEMSAVQGDLPRAMACSEHALELLPEGQSFLRASVAATLGTIYVAAGEMAAGVNAYALSRDISVAAGNIPAVVGSLASQGYLQVLQGRLSVAAATFQQAVDIAAAQASPPPLACMAYVGLGRVWYEQNAFEQATDALRRGLKLGQQRGDTVVLIRSLATLARIQHLSGETAEATTLRAQLDQIARTAHSPAHAAQAAASYARLALAEGELEPAARWAEASGMTATDHLSYQREFGHLTLARVLLAQERLEEAAALVERLRDAAERGGRGERVIESLVLQALTFQAQGARAAALAALTHALTLGEAEGYLRLFLDEGDPLRLLLAKLWRVRQHPSARQLTPSLHRYLSTLLAASPPEVPPGVTAGHAAAARRQRDLLSHREREILRLMTEGKSNQEIAAVLVIEPTTVMWHLKQLFSKLDVHSRTQAIARARALGLL